MLHNNDIPVNILTCTTAWFNRVEYNQLKQQTSQATLQVRTL